MKQKKPVRSDDHPKASVAQLHQAPVFPIRVYFYNHEGYYNEPLMVQDMVELTDLLRKRVKEHIEAGLEVMFTDPGDLCLFHAKDGKILFPTEQDIAKLGE